MKLKKILSQLLIACSFFANVQGFSLEEKAPNEQQVFYRFGFIPTEALNIADYFLPSNPIIIDAGAFKGDESVTMAQRWPLGQIHSFEPIPDIYGALTQTTLNIPNIKTYNLALSHLDGIAEMFVSEWAFLPGVSSMSSSLLPPKEHLNLYEGIIFPKSIFVQTLKMDTWAQLCKIDHVDLLWLDMQGVELEVLKASPQILSTVKVILTEVEFVEIYENQSLYQDLKNWLEEQDFVLVGGNFNPLNPTENNQWFGDALFVKKELISSH